MRHYLISENVNNSGWPLTGTQTPCTDHGPMVIPRTDRYTDDDECYQTVLHPCLSMDKKSFLIFQISFGNV